MIRINHYIHSLRHDVFIRIINDFSKYSMIYKGTTLI